MFLCSGLYTWIRLRTGWCRSVSACAFIIRSGFRQKAGLLGLKPLHHTLHKGQDHVT